MNRGGFGQQLSSRKVSTLGDFSLEALLLERLLVETFPLEALPPETFRLATNHDNVWPTLFAGLVYKNKAQ